MNHVFNANVIMLMQFIFFKVHIGRVGNNARFCKQNHWEILDVALLKHFIYRKIWRREKNDQQSAFHLCFIILGFFITFVYFIVLLFVSASHRNTSLIRSLVHLA